jgi:hypothetical protein
MSVEHKTSDEFMREARSAAALIVSDPQATIDEQAVQDLAILLAVVYNLGVDSVICEGSNEA